MCYFSDSIRSKNCYCYSIYYCKLELDILWWAEDYLDEEWLEDDKLKFDDISIELD